MVEDNSRTKKKIIDSPAFAVGSLVQVAKLKQNGIIQEVMSKGRYRVGVGSILITCMASELSARIAVQVTASNPATIKTPKVGAPPQTLDLHGETVDEALRKLDSWIDRALLSGLSRIKVIHGFGTGKVQRAVHSYLEKSVVVASFRLNSFNAGETEIFL